MTTMCVKILNRKDGNNIAEYVYRIDKTKPKCYRDGFEYKFNSTLLDIVVHKGIRA